jgi:hypothetical protein
MTRAEHLAWAKQRALEHLDAGDEQGAFTSMISDLRKHDELENHIGLEMGVMLMATGLMIGRPGETRRWIEGFN